MIKLIKSLLSLFCKKEKSQIKEKTTYKSNLPPIELYELNRHNFKYTEFYYSKTAKEMGIDNTPIDQGVLLNLMKLADNMQTLHSFIQDKYTNDKVIIDITSGYRNPTLNKIVGGSPTSVHMEGKAVDFIVRINEKPLALEDVAKYIIEVGIAFDQILIEYEKGIVHMGLADNDKEARQQVKTAWLDKGEWKTKTIKL